MSADVYAVAEAQNDAALSGRTFEPGDRRDDDTREVDAVAAAVNIGAKCRGTQSDLMRAAESLAHVGRRAEARKLRALAQRIDDVLAETVEARAVAMRRFHEAHARREAGKK